MTICSPTQVRNWSRVRDGRRRFDSLTIGLHWATVALITGMFASAWALLASDREHAAILLNVHRSLGVVTWAVAIVRLACDLVSPIFRHFPKPCRGPNSGLPRPVNMAFTPCCYCSH